MERVFSACILIVALSSAPRQAAAAQSSPVNAPAPSPAQTAACVQSQQQVAALIDVAQNRIELSRQTNDPTAMRAAIADLQTTLSGVRAQLASCVKLAQSASPDPHAGHNMANMQMPNNRVAPAGNAAASGTVISKVSGTVTMAAADHVMLKTDDGQDAMFKVTSATRVTNGAQTIRSSDLAMGTRIVVTPSATDPETAAIVETAGARR
jgi:hypothetical protein